MCNSRHFKAGILTEPGSLCRALRLLAPLLLEPFFFNLFHLEIFCYSHI
jgi:hypothetical protein